MGRVLLTSILVACLASTALSDIRKVRPDGTISFTAAMDGPTRISVKGDRIKDVIQTDSQFEMVNDADTGDVFLRFIGDSPEPESGYIITEAGHTVGFKMTPRPGLETQTLLIHLVGVPDPMAAEADNLSGSDVGTSGFAVSDGLADSYAGGLTTLVREAILEKIAGRSAGKMRSTTPVGTLRKGGLVARVFAAKAPSGLRPAPQSFYSSRTLAVWVDDVVSDDRVWVVTVEGRP